MLVQSGFEAKWVFIKVNKKLGFQSILNFKFEETADQPYPLGTPKGLRM